MELTVKREQNSVIVECKSFDDRYKFCQACREAINYSDHTMDRSEIMAVVERGEPLGMFEFPLSLWLQPVMIVPCTSINLHACFGIVVLGKLGL